MEDIPLRAASLSFSVAFFSGLLLREGLEEAFVVTGWPFPLRNGAGGGGVSTDMLSFWEPMTLNAFRILDFDLINAFRCQRYGVDAKF